MNWILARIPPWLRLFVRLTRPLFLLGGVLLYALGVGVADYLGESIDWRAYWLGQTCVSLLQLSAHYLNEYFDALGDADNPNRTPFSGGSGVTELPKQTALAAAGVTLTGGAVTTVLLYAFGYLNPAVLIIIGLAFAIAIAYSVPPLRLVSSGYGELAASILVANLVPALGLLLQMGELHRLLALATFPLTFLHLAMLMAFSLPDYAADMKYGKRTLMLRLGWQRGMTLHNILIVTAYVLLVVALLQGMSFNLVWPAMLSLPLGMFQVWMMVQLANGAPARWAMLTLGAIALFAITAYCQTLAFWTG